MSLIVSLRVPDGVVLAADSLQTTQGIIIPGLKNLTVKNPKTKEDIKIGDLNLPAIKIPTSTSAYAQKLFPFDGKFGIASFGTSIINNRTIYNHIKTLENSINEEVDSVSKAAEMIKDYFDDQLQNELKQKKDQKLEKDTVVLGFQVVGYETKEDITGRAIEIIIGEKSKIKIIDGLGCSVSGDTVVVRKLWELSIKMDIKQTNFGSFSLKDAVDYSKFLIETTSEFQRFANMIPTVGGAVDIALITNYSKFTWIKYKELTKILEKIN